MFSTIMRYNKAIIALAILLGYGGVKYYAPDILPEEVDPMMVDLIATALTTLGVYAVPNKGSAT